VRTGAARSRRVLPVHAERQRAPESQPPRRHAPAGRPEPIDEARPRFPPDDGDEHEREHAQDADEEPGAAEESDEQQDDEMEIDYEDAFGEGTLDDEAVDDELESTDELDPGARDDDER